MKTANVVPVSASRALTSFAFRAWRIPAVRDQTAPGANHLTHRHAAPYCAFRPLRAVGLPSMGLAVKTHAAYTPSDQVLAAGVRVV